MAFDKPFDDTQGNVVDLFTKRTDTDTTDTDTTEPGAALEARADPSVDRVLEGEVVTPVYRQPFTARPVLPTWVTDRADRDAARRWATAYLKHEAKYRAVRLPRYTTRLLLVYTPRGAWRAALAWRGWVFDHEGAPLRAKAVESDARGDYLVLSKQRSERVKTRLKVSGGVAAGAVVAAELAWVAWPLAPWALLALAVVLLGWHGRSLDKATFDKAVITAGVAPKLTPTMVVRALGALGIAEINKALKAGKAGEGIAFVADPCRDGPGWRADVDLPFGVTANDVIAKRDRLASGLRRPLGCVWPEGNADQHAGRLVVWVGDHQLNKLRMPPWPLGEGHADGFAPLPLGVDPRGRPVTLTLMYSNLLLGSLPRQGKTFSLRILLLALALDALFELRTFELKGTGDLAPLAKVSHHYASGLTDEAIYACLQSLRELVSELDRRSEVIKKLAQQRPDICRENKVTRQIAEMRELKLQPIVIAIDEAQNLFAHPTYGDEAGRHAERIIRVGPAMGVMLVLATQRPNKDALPTAVSSLVATRFCLRVMDQTANDMVLGTSMYQNGVRATSFTRKDLGIGYLVGDADDPQIVRTYYIDNPGADAVCERARELREHAGTLSGVAAGDIDVIEATEDLLDHVAAVWRTGEDELWNETIVGRLAQDHPELYGEWDATDLGNALAAFGIERRQIERYDEAAGKRRNLRGIDRQTLQHALQARCGVR